MSLDPHNLLAKVEPDLVKTLTKAYDGTFVVVYGIRTIQEEQQAIKTGHSTTMHSRHLPDTKGLSAAVDVASVSANGQPSWAPGHEQPVFGLIATKVKQAAQERNIPVEWGGDWLTFKDWGHFQLPWKEYP